MSNSTSTADEMGEGSAASLTTRNSTTAFFIGLAIVIGASVLNAFGLNLTKLDHAKESERPRHERRKSYLRPLWALGLLAYIVSQLVGSTLALEFLRSEYVAPLGSSSLIFNVLFARILVHTKVTKLDVIGTLVIIVGVVGVVAFGNQRSPDAPDTEEHLNLETLKELWAKPAWLAFFFVLELLTTIAWWLASISDEVLREREEVDSDQERPEEDRYIRGGGGRKPVDPDANSFLRVLGRVRESTRALLKGHFANWAARQPDTTVKRIGGFLWSVLAGLLASQTLIFAKSAVKLFSTQANHPDENQFAHILSIFILILLAFTAVSQIFALNRGLAVADSTVVVPSMFALYSGFGFTNSLFYLDQLNVYSKTITALICLSLLVLLIGVGILSSKKTEPAVKPPKADLESTPGQNDGEYGRKSGEEEDAYETARSRGSEAADMEGDLGRSSFVDDTKAKLQNAVSSIKFSRKGGGRDRDTKGRQLLGRGVDRPEDEEAGEVHELPSLDFSQEHEDGHHRRRRSSLASLSDDKSDFDDFQESADFRKTQPRRSSSSLSDDEDPFASGKDPKYTA